MFRQMAMDKGRQLRALPFSSLTGIAGEPGEEVILGTRKGTFSVIVEPCEDGRLKIVVQGFLEGRWLGFKDVALDGFYKHPDGSITEMRNSEFYEYD